MGRMKFRWDKSLRDIVLLTLSLGAVRVCAQSVSVQGETAAAPSQVVREIRVVKENGSLLKTNPTGIAVKIGEPLTRDDVAASIRTLYQTGDYADLRAVVTPQPDGLRLEFIARENLFINQVLVQGLIAPPTETSAVAAMQLSLGEADHAGDIEDAVGRLKDTLQDEGLYQATVTIERQAHPETHQIDIIAHVNPGPRVRLQNIQLVNNTSFKDGELLKLFKLRTGSELTKTRAQSGTDRLRKFLEKTGHLSARLSIRRGEYKQSSNSLPLILEVNEGPAIHVTVQGAKFSKGELKKLIPVYQEASVDTDLLEEGKRNLRERMERQGYFDAIVDYAVTSQGVSPSNQELGPKEENIVYKVDRGVRYKGLDIAIAGNHYFSASLLRSRLSITPSSLFVRPRFSRRMLDADVLSMKNLYAANGFLSATVTAAAPPENNQKGGNLLVRFEINEGKQTLVSQLKIEGMKSISEDEIRGVLGSLPGQPYSEISVSSDRDNILALYFNQGFPNATFSWTVEPDDSAVQSAPSAKKPGHRAASSNSPDPPPGLPIERAQPMKLVYKINEGAQVIVNRILLAGYRRTHPNVIQREVKLTGGQPLREGDVVESQQKLYNLGVFNRVSINPQNANGTDPEKDVVVLVEEAKRYTIAYGGGFEAQRLASTTDPTGGQVQASPRGIFEISKQNLTGRADSLSLKLRGSTIQGRALLAYSAPRPFNIQNLSFQATAYVEKTQDINTFTQTRYEGNLQVTDQLSPRASFLVRYAFRKVVLSNLNIPAEEVPLFNQPTLVSEFSATWYRDTRDNPADATKGSFNTADVSVAGTAFGSSASFIRVFLQNSTYRKITRNWSFARSLRIGILQPYASTVSLSFPSQSGTPLPQLIPLPERLYAGGGTSLRGFALNQAGPRDSLTGFPVGGQAMLIFNQELRFPLKVPFVGNNLGGAFFYDGGNVYSRLSHITLRWKPPEPIFKPAYPGQTPGRFNPEQCEFNCTNELNYFSHTVGFGLRYATPVGPIRVDIGYDINQPHFVIPCRSAAVLCQQATRLPKIQVFFNLGSSF
jgi:outer membrane protein insertion porin family